MGAEEHAKHPTWALLRIVLGWLQMAGALTTALLVLSSGVTPIALAVAAVTAALVAVSLLLFRRR